MHLSVWHNTAGWFEWSFCGPSSSSNPIRAAFLHQLENQDCFIPFILLCFFRLFWLMLFLFNALVVLCVCAEGNKKPNKVPAPPLRPIKKLPFTQLSP